MVEKYEPIYDRDGIWEVHFELPKMIDQKLLDQCDEVWKKIKLTFTDECAKKNIMQIFTNKTW